MLASETPAFDDKPGPLRPGRPGIVGPVGAGAGAGAGGRGAPKRGTPCGAVRGLLATLLFTTGLTVAAATAPPLICKSVSNPHE